MTEKWKYIKSFGNKYEVSSFGRIRNRNTGRFLKQFRNYSGYSIVALRDYENKKTFAVSRLVASHFLYKTRERKEVNHIDGNKDNNTLLNLQYVTRSENIKHAVLNRLTKPMKGELNGNSKLKDSDVILIRKIYKELGSYRKIAKLFNIGKTTVVRVVRRQNWKHI